MKKAKYEIDDIVRYLPKMSGFDPDTELVIESVNYVEHDDLCDALGVLFEPTWVYHFEHSSLMAVEKNIELFTHTFEIG